MSVLAAAGVRCIVADPPWQFGDRLPGPKRGASKHYATMAIGQLVAWRETWPFKVAGDCHLLLWRVAAMQEEALQLAAAWGFTVKSELVWLKRTATGKRWFGMGHQVRAEHEVCLIATHGRAQPLRRNQRSTFEGVARDHSRKPEEFYTIVESLFPGPRVELFARTRRPGWLQLGDELPEETAHA